MYIYLEVTLMQEPILIVLFEIEKVHRAIYSFSIDTQIIYNYKQTQNTIKESCTQNPEHILIGLDRMLITMSEYTMNR